MARDSQHLSPKLYAKCIPTCKGGARNAPQLQLGNRESIVRKVLSSPARKSRNFKMEKQQANYTSVFEARESQLGSAQVCFFFFFAKHTSAAKTATLRSKAAHIWPWFKTNGTISG